jgi:putative tricarboxylic transport membrane protein
MYDFSPLMTRRVWCALIAGLLSTSPPVFAAGWEPSKPIELLVPAGTGGGADQMARFIQGIVSKYSLMKQPLIVVNKARGDGADAFFEMKKARGDPHKIIITLSNLFTTPLATGMPFNWKDLTPVAMLALDQFVLWVNADAPYKTARDYLEAVKVGGPNKFKMGGTGWKQEDQIITVAIEKAAGVKFTYVPYKGGGDVSLRLAEMRIDSSVNNPIEAVLQWRAGKLRPLCVLGAQRISYKATVTNNMSWNDIPRCREAGINVDYLMLRAIFMPPGVAVEQISFYAELFKRVRQTAEWKKFMEDGAFDTTYIAGSELEQWIEKAENRHRELMRDAGFLSRQ